jgi:hypothetical protein
MPRLLFAGARAVKTLIREAAFFAIAAAVILPTPTLVWAYVTGKTISEVLYR